MILKKVLTTIGAVMFGTLVMTTLSHAQSSIERLAVPKAKLISGFWKKNDPNSTIKVDHGFWDKFLKTYVRSNGAGANVVAYGRVSSADKQGLADYLKTLQAVDVSKLSRDEQYAFWLNLYNATTVKVVLDHRPIKSIRDVKSGAFDFLGPFNDKLIKVNGKPLTLNDVESGIVRPIWRDPLLHYGFNCAAISCPNLNTEAFRGDQVHAQLGRLARAYVNNSRGVKIEGGKITASKIYFWYEGDFGGSEAKTLDHIRRYASADLKSKLAGKKDIDAFVYDWSLNGR